MACDPPILILAPVGQSLWASYIPTIWGPTGLSPRPRAPILGMLPP